MNSGKYLCLSIDFTLVKRKPSRNLALMAKCDVTYSLIRKQKNYVMFTTTYTTCVSDAKGRLNIVADDMHKRSSSMLPYVRTLFSVVVQEDYLSPSDNDADVLILHKSRK